MTESTINRSAPGSTRAGLDERVAHIRRFNRFYTQKIGVLHEGLLDSPFSLTEGRVLYELAHGEAVTARALSRELGLDAGYVSRMLTSFEARGLIAKQPSSTDGRQILLALTPAGRAAFAPLDKRAYDEIAAIIGNLLESEQRRLVEAMTTIRGVFGGRPSSVPPYILRTHQPGDMGWIVHRQGLLYWQEYAWDERFEAIVAEITAKFINEFDSRRERCWIAEMDGEIVGSVFCVKDTETTATLRLLYVEPKARGLGLGLRLVDECIRFARQAGYRTLTLWTNDVLAAARRIYEQEGFRLVKEEPHHSFGHDLVGQNWSLDL